GPASETAPALNIPLRLERLPAEDEPADDLDLAVDPAPVLGRPIESRLAPEPDAKPTKPQGREAPEEPASPSPTRRSSAVFGRLLGSGGESAGKDGLSVESTGDPAVEAAVKRRV